MSSLNMADLDKTVEGLKIRKGPQEDTMECLQKEVLCLQRKLSEGNPHYGVSHTKYPVSPIYQNSTRQEEPIMVESRESNVERLRKEKLRLQRELSGGNPHYGVKHTKYPVSPIYQRPQHQEKPEEGDDKTES